MIFRRHQRCGISALLIAIFVLISATSLHAAAASTGSTGGSVSGGSIRGQVLDNQGVEIPGVTLILKLENGEGAPRSAFSGAEGEFVFEYLQPGKYQIEAKLPGFDPATENLSILSDEVISLRFNLKPMSFTGSVEVTASEQAHSEAQLLDKRRQAAAVTDSISSEEISKSADSDASEVVTRLTGLSVVSGKYVSVRGLGERYSHVTLNGAKISTTETEKRVVPLDLFPAEILQTVEVSKTYTPDREGEFAGGDLDLSTLDFPGETQLGISMGLGFQDGTTGEDFGSYAGGLSWDGDGGQPKPAELPGDFLQRRSFVNPDGLSPEELQQIGRSFAPHWEPGLHSAPPNSETSFTYGKSPSKKFGFIISGMLGHSYQAIDDEVQNFYGLDDGDLVTRNDYSFRSDRESTRNGVLASMGYRINPDHKLSLTSLFLRNASSVSRFQEGYNSNDGNNIRDYRLQYTVEEISSNLLSGSHHFAGPGAGSELSWSAAFAHSTRDFDLRENLYHEIDPGVYWLNIGAPESGKIEYHRLNEDLLNLKASWSAYFAPGEANYGSLRVGLAYSDRDRDFGARRFRFITRNPSMFDLSLMPDELFQATNIGPEGWEILEQTGLNDAYSGSHTISGAFAMVDWSHGDWRFIGGLRAEKSEQRVVTTNPFDTDHMVESTLDDTDLLPAVNLVRALGPETNLRIGLSRTVNRPDFRELSPFFFQDVTGGWGTAGNPDLQVAHINALDVRFETFPDSGEVMALSAFYKKLEDPIEKIIQPTTEYLLSYVNADAATLWGMEIEFRRRLSMISPRLQHFTVNLNYTYTHSDVRIPRDSLSAITNTNRPLEGQAEAVGNISLEFHQAEWGTTLRCLFNYTGRRIANVGAFGLPDIYQSPLRGLDVMYSQDLNSILEGLSMKLTASNLLDSAHRFMQGPKLQQYFSIGRSYSLSFSYRFDGGATQ